MKTDTTDAAGSTIGVDQRIVTLTTLYNDLSLTLNLQLAELRKGDLAQGKPLIKKLDELCSVLLALIKAEEAFHEKIKSTAAGHFIDADALRADIGSKLDRIRDAHGTSAVFKRTDG